MSLDYPNRADWLAVRYTSPTPRSGRLIVRGRTYSAGRRAFKTKRLEVKLARKAEFRAARRTGLLGVSATV